VPVTSGVLVTQQIVECLAIRGTEPKVYPPKSVPQVAEANAEAELTVALRTAFHSTSTDQADFAMLRHRQRKRSMAGLPANSCQREIGGGRRVRVNRRSTNKSRASSIQIS
jgi:hypothetical protein